MSKLFKFLLIICREYIKENRIGIILYSASILVGLVSMLFFAGKPSYGALDAFLIGAFGFMVVYIGIGGAIFIVIELTRPLREYVKKVWNSIED